MTIKTRHKSGIFCHDHMYSSVASGFKQVKLKQKCHFLCWLKYGSIGEEVCRHFLKIQSTQAMHFSSHSLVLSSSEKNRNKIHYRFQGKGIMQKSVSSFYLPNKARCIRQKNRNVHHLHCLYLFRERRNCTLVENFCHGWMKQSQIYESWKVVTVLNSLHDIYNKSVSYNEISII